MTDLNALLDDVMAQPGGNQIAQYVLRDLEKIAPLLNHPASIPGAVALLSQWANEPEDGSHMLRKRMASAWLDRARVMMATPPMISHDMPGDDRDHSHPVGQEAAKYTRTPSQIEAQNEEEDDDPEEARKRGRGRMKGGLGKLAELAKFDEAKHERDHGKFASHHSLGAAAAGGAAVLAGVGGAAAAAHYARTTHGKVSIAVAHHYVASAAESAHHYMSAGAEAAHHHLTAGATLAKHYASAGMHAASKHVGEAAMAAADHVELGAAYAAHHIHRGAEAAAQHLHDGIAAGVDHAQAAGEAAAHYGRTASEAAAHFAGTAGEAVMHHAGAASAAAAHAARGGMGAVAGMASKVLSHFHKDVPDGDLRKAFDESKHKRDHGQFASAAIGAGGAVAGAGAATAVIGHGVRSGAIHSAPLPPHHMDAFQHSVMESMSHTLSGDHELSQKVMRAGVRKLKIAAYQHLAHQHGGKIGAAGLVAGAAGYAAHRLLRDPGDE